MFPFLSQKTLPFHILPLSFLLIFIPSYSWIWEQEKHDTLLFLVYMQKVPKVKWYAIIALDTEGYGATFAVPYNQNGLLHPIRISYVEIGLENISFFLMIGFHGTKVKRL